MTPPAERKVCATCFYRRQRRRNRGACRHPDQDRFFTRLHDSCDYHKPAREGRSDDEQ